MNPPYNNDMYIDFVTLAHEIASDAVVAITPAKGLSARNGERFDKFRKNVVAHISDLVDYPDCSDVFQIAEPGGICFYMITNQNIEETNIENRSKLQQLYNDKCRRNISNRQTLINKGNIINIRLKDVEKVELTHFDKDKQWQLWLNNKLAIGGGKKQGTYLMTKEGKFQCLSLSRIVDKNNPVGIINDSLLMFSADTKEECIYFDSWIKTKLVRYLISINLNGLTGVANCNNDWWRFVPDPGTFDHIFTDDELYKKYNLTPEEINIIESVIKARD